MPTSPLNRVVQHLLADLRPDGDGKTDGELLADFLRSRDEDALAALVRRHAPMVWGVCRRLLNHHDAEDAFQATFLVLVRKAADVPRQAVANWLYGVARQTTVRLRATAAKRGRRETQVVNMPEPTVEEVHDADLQRVLDEELSRLPDHYRGVVVLCDLEGMTRKEAARQLGIPEGSVASRLARARAMLAKRLAQRGLFSGGSLAVLSAGSALASAPPTLVASTIQAAGLLAAGKAAATVLISAKVAALTEGVTRAMFLARLKTVTGALVLTVLLGLGGLALGPGSGQLPAAGAEAQQKEEDRKPDTQAQKLVRQLGSLKFAQRQEAEKALADMGAQAAASVRAGMRDADLEVARRCTALWPRLWQTEIARPDLDRLANFAHPLWLRFRKVAGDDASSRKLFSQLAADLGRFQKLEAIDAEPARAADAYTAELKERVEALNQGWREAEAAVRYHPPFTTGLIRPSSGYPTQLEFATLLFLGTFPSTAAVTYRGTEHHDSASHSMVFALGEAQSPALRRLFGSWLETRTDQGAIQLGLSQVVRSPIAEVLPAARKHAASAKLEAGTRALALLVIGRLGGGEDLPLLKRAFADARVWYTTRWSSGTGKERIIEVQVGDTALGSALWIFGQRAADFGFPIAEMLRNHPDTLAQYGLLGFLDNDTRQAAHTKAEQWLEEHKNEKAVRYQVKDWQTLFDGKTTNNWKTAGQVTIEDGLLKVGGDKGGSIVTTASYARGSLSFAYRQAGDAKTTLTWRGEELAFSPARQGWTSQGYDPDAKGESLIRIIAPPGTTLWLRELAFRPY
jgi:RNA polymerase sigma factor (sigma-70 family)